MMNHVTQRVVVSLLLLSAPMVVLAQGAPARETPRPQDVDPGVNTSAPSQAPSSTRDTAAPGPASSAATRESRPQDIDPAVNTSAAAPANEDGGASSSSSAGAAGSGASARTTGSGAAKSATSKAGSTAAPNTVAAPNSTATSSTQNPSASKVGPDGKPIKGKALDRLELDTTQITGNRELPKVLYIVPWKRSDLGDLTGKPVNSLVDEVLTPVDRDVFKRENRYYRALENAPANGTTAPSSSTSPASATDSGSANPAARDER